jgi:hypothetical protein
MKPLTKETLDRVARLHVISNTPYYLYDQLRSDDVVRSLATRMSSREIKDMLKAYKTKWARRWNSAMAQYALLVALSFKPVAEFRRFLASYTTPHLRWLAEFKSIILASQSTNSAVQVELSMPDLVAGTTKTRSTAANTSTVAGAT